MNRKARRIQQSTKSRNLAITEAAIRRSREWVVVPVDPALRVKYPAAKNVVRVLRNDFYVVQWYEFSCAIGNMIHLAIRSIKGAGTSRGTEPRWQELQRIKNEVVGEGAEAVQVCPKQHHLTDQADMYHLFVLPSEWPLPFGLHRENGLFREGDRA